MSDQVPPPPVPQPQIVYVEAPAKKHRIRKFLLIGLGIIVLMAAISALAGGTDETTSSGNSSQTSSSASNSSSSRTAISFDKIVADTEGMTDAQFDRYVESAEKNNRAANWTATVTDVDDQVFGSEYFAHLTVNPGETFDFYDISIDIAEEVALSLNLNDEITFSGEIKDIDNTLDLLVVSLNKVTIHSVNGS